MTADAKAIAAAYGGEARGNSALVPTPGHSPRDRGTSIKIDASAPDGVVVHSFNGGDALAMKDDMRARGLLPLRDTARRSSGSAKWECKGTYEYDDGKGNVVYRTRRLERGGDKRFVAERLEGGRWVTGIGDCIRYPYRFTDLCNLAHEAREAGEPEPIIYLVEGERKADKLVSWGLSATAIAFGANGWKADAYGPAFANATIAILPDNDEPGRKYAEIAMKSIEAHGGEAFTVDLPGLPPKGDIIDWEGDVDQLRQLTEKARYSIKETLPLFDLAALDGPPPPARTWALEGLIPARELTLFTGPGGAGKSLFGQQLATCIASGELFLGVATMRAPALYVTAEDDESELHRRQRNICAALDVQSLTGKLHLSSLRGRLGNELCTFDSEGRLRPAPSFQLLIETIRQTGARFVVLDNVAHLFTGNENDRGQVTQFANLLNRVAVETDAAVLLVAHPNKAGDAYSGSTAWLNAVRSQLEINRPKESDGSMSDPDARVLNLGKANYARHGETLSFRWHDFAFILDGDLPKGEAGELAKVAANARDNDLFLGCLRERIRQQRAVSEKRSPTFAPSVFATMAESQKIGRARLERAMDRLFRLGTVERAELWKGPDRKPVFGLRETTEKSAGNGAGNTMRETRETVLKAAENRAGDALDIHTPPKGGIGAALGSPAPTPKGEQD